MSTPVAEFFARYPFDPDPFQVEAARAWEDGHSVVVAAPTGSGKTVVAEYAIATAFERGGKAFYTTPLKALSNQKFGDFSRIYGAERVGLLTGDNSINPSASLVVMTTEVLRNMIYEDSQRLDRLHVVVLDEVHYLQDRFRGAVWEEVIIHLPPSVRLVCLSATVSNTEEFAEWVSTVRGPTRAVVAADRPVPLHHLFCVGDRRTEDLLLMPLFAPGGEEEGKPNPALARLEERPSRHGPAGPGRRQRTPLFTPRRLELTDLLDDKGMLPAIVFVFSRAGCDAAVQACVQAGIRLLDGPAEREDALSRLDARVKGLSDNELAVLGYAAFADALGAGIAPHHAGLVPAFKEAVEDCFAAGLVRLVFATETLSLGINMPARTVVIEKLSKFTGETHELLTPGQYTQLTGRAGRRGIDTVGYAVVLWSPWVSIARVVGLAAAATYTLTSSFRPDYNMAANLVRRYPRDQAEDLLNSSFAQFRTDRNLVRMEANLVRRRRALEGYVGAASCELGDVEEYHRLRQAARSGHRDRRQLAEEKARQVLGRAKPGDVLHLPRRRGSDIAAVISRSHTRAGSPRLVVVTRTGRSDVVGLRELSGLPVKVGSVELPRPFAERSPVFRRQVATLLTGLGPSEEQPEDDAPEETEGYQAHPVDECPDRDRHVAFFGRAEDMRREIDRIDLRLHRRADALSRTFERVLEVLARLGYVEGWELTPRGEILAVLYSEVDLLITEALSEGIFSELAAEELAAIVSCFTYEPRADDLGPPLPGGARLREALGRLRVLWRDVADTETDLGLPITREPHPGFADYAYRWAQGESLDEVLGDDELPGGDFVRQAKQVIDVLRQLAQIDESIPFGEAADRLERGVVAYSSL